MRCIDASTCSAQRPWAAIDIAEIDDATVRLPWTEQPYQWDVNDGPEVFVVMHRAVDMHYRNDGQDHDERLTPGPVCQADPGDERLAQPAPGAPILVIEHPGSS